MRLRETGLTVFGLVVTATPLALWVAWSEAVFILALAVCVSALTAICLLAGAGQTAEENKRHEATQKLSDESLAKLSDLGPFVYHHRPKSGGGTRFQANMRALKSRLR